MNQFPRIAQPIPVPDMRIVQRPSDTAMVLAIALTYRVSEETVLGWLRTMDLRQVAEYFREDAIIEEEFNPA